MKLGGRLNTALAAAKKAGDFILKSSLTLRPSDVVVKSQNNFVTWVDRQSETLIRKIISRAHPADAVLGEEAGLSGSGPVRWIVDPLDGTSNFIHSIPFFAVSIGVEINGRVEAGVISVPSRGELFAAQRGHGATLNGRPIHTSNRTAMNASIVGTAVPYKSISTRWNKYEVLLRSIARSGADTRRSGALAVDLAYVACGRMDALWAFDQAPWDVAAGSLLVTEAGGVISNLWDIQKSGAEGDIAAGNHPLHKTILQLASRSVSPKKLKR